MNAYLGIDWDTKQLKAYFSCNGQKPVKIIFNEPSFTEVQMKIDQLKEQNSSITTITTMVEAGAKQWNNLLHAVGLELYVVNPKKAKRFKESLQTTRAKDDLRDAKALLALAKSPAHQDNIKRFKPSSTIERKIDLLAKMHEDAKKEMSRLKQQFRSYLQKTCPMIETFISSMDALWVFDFFSEIASVWQLEQLNKEQFLTIMSGTKMRHKNRESFWLAVEKNRGNPLANKDLHEIEKMRTSDFVKRLRYLRDHLKSLEVKIESTLSSLPIAKSISKMNGIGSICTLLLCHYGHLDSLERRDDLSIILGASPVFVGSGTTRKGENKGYASMRREVPSQSRSLTYMIGLSLMQYSKWGKAMYEDGKERNQRAGTIFRRISRSFLRIVTSMIKNGTEYDEEKYIKALIKKGVPWAQKLQPCI